MLGGIYAATITVFLDDESEGWAETRAFLARRIEGIMRFEKAKAGFLKRVEHRPSLSRFIGRLRNPVVLQFVPPGTPGGAFLNQSSLDRKRVVEVKSVSVGVYLGG